LFFLPTLPLTTVLITSNLTLPDFGSHQKGMGTMTNLIPLWELGTSFASLASMTRFLCINLPF
jgi:hypothetical protein